MLGPGKTYELLMSEKPISAETALAQGLVDRVVPAEGLEASALDAAAGFAGQSTGSLLGIKRLMNDQIDDLQQHLEYENEVLRLTIRSKAFRARLQQVVSGD